MPVAENPEDGRKPGHNHPSEPGQDHDEDIVCDLHCPDDVVLKSAHGCAPLYSITTVSLPGKQGVNVAQHPILLLHIAADPRAGVPTARQYSGKDVSRPLLPGNAAGDIQRITGPIHLHGVPGLVRDAHRSPFATLFPLISASNQR